MGAKLWDSAHPSGFMVLPGLETVSGGLPPLRPGNSPVILDDVDDEEGIGSD